MGTLESAIPGVSEGGEGVFDPSPTYGDPVGPDGELLTIEEGKAAEKAMKLFRSHDELLKGVLAQVKLNGWWRRGITGARLIQDPATGQWRARPPSKVRVNASFINKAASICRKFVGVLTADPPAPEAVPGEGDGDDPSSAEFATRALIHTDEELSRTAKLTRAIDEALECQATFERFFYNPTGQRVPIEIQAGFHPGNPDLGEPPREAQTVDDAEFETITEWVIDPETGEPVEAPAGERPWPMFRARFVREDGTLTDERGEAATRWQGKIDSEILRLENVRLYPHTAYSIEEAWGVGILSWVAWGQLRKNNQFKEKLDELPKEKLDAIFNWRKDWAEAALPVGMDQKQIEKVRQGGNKDEFLVPVLTHYFNGAKCSTDYPRGLYMVQVADIVVLHRGTWEYEDASGVMTPHEIPLSQLTLFREGRPGWTGAALMEIIGPGNEIRAAQIGSLLDYLDRIGSLKTLIPTSSIINEHEYSDRTKRVLRYNYDGGTPSIEDLPPYPQAAESMFAAMTEELNDASGLQESAQGLEASTVKSGVQAMTVLSQVQAALSPQARAVVEFFVRGGRIELELIRAHYERQRQLSWTGEDGRYKQQAWSRADLGTTTDVRLEAGTMTMLRPAQKAILSREYFQMGLMPPEEFLLTAERNVGGTLAVRDNPFRQRIRRQIEDWKEGPPEDWEPPRPMMQPILDEAGDPVMEIDPETGEEIPAGEPVIDEMTGQPMMQPDPFAMRLWKPVPSDEDPKVATLRLYELYRLTATVAYENKPDEYKLMVAAEVDRMRMALMVMAAPDAGLQSSGEEGATSGEPAGGPGGGQGGEPPNPEPHPMATAIS